jgi:hypothetical protein
MWGAQGGICKYIFFNLIACSLYKAKDLSAPSHEKSMEEWRYGPTHSFPQQGQSCVGLRTRSSMVVNTEVYIRQELNP